MSSVDSHQWLIGNQRKSKRRYLEPIHILWLVGWGLLSIAFFFIPFTQSLWLWVPTALLFVFGGLIPTSDGPGFLYVWDRYQHFRRQKNPEEETDESENEEGSDKVDKKERRQPRRPPIDAIPMEYYDSNSDRRTGVLYLPHRIADASLIVSQGFDGAMLDSEEFYQRMDSISDSFLEAARNSLYPIGMTQGLIKRPYDTSRSRDWQLSNVPAKILASVPGTTWQEVANGKPVDQVIADSTRQLDRKLTAEEVLHLDMIQRDARRQKYSSDTYCFYGQTVGRPEDWELGNRGVISGLLTQDQLNQAPIVRLTKLVEQGLIANGALGVQTLDLDGLSNHLRKAWDMNPNTLEAWNEGELFTRDGKPFDPTNMWPPFNFSTGVDAKGLPYSNYGGTLHRTYLITGLDKKVIRPRQFRELFQPGYLGPTDEVGYGAVLVGETVLSSEEVRAATQSIRFKKAVSRLNGSDSGDRDVSAREREEAQLQERERDAYDYGGSHVLNHNFYIDLAVHSGDLKASLNRLAEVDERFKLTTQLLRVNTRPLRLAPHMNRALWTMFGAAGMM